MKFSNLVQVGIFLLCAIFKSAFGQKDLGGASLDEVCAFDVVKIVVESDNAANVFSTQLFTFVEGTLRSPNFDLSDKGKIPGFKLKVLGKLLDESPGFTTTAAALPDKTLFVACDDAGNDPANATTDILASNVAYDDTKTSLYTAILAGDPAVVRGPRMFCIEDSNAMCAGNRPPVTVQTRCNRRGDNSFTCNDFIAFFSLYWLFGWIAATYVIIILWAIYMLYPKMKRMCCGGGQAAKRSNSGPHVDPQQQIIINTLATQCSGAESLLFQATELMKHARAQQNIITVAARNETKLMYITCQYFQAVCSTVVILTHQYLYDKTKNRGEKVSGEDAGARALQLEILMYVRERLQLAFAAEAWTEKSLLRIAEAYAILKRVSENLVFVDFKSDAQSNLHGVRTTVVDLDENAIFVSGTFSNSRGFGDPSMEGQEVCVPVRGADTRGNKPVPANYYLGDSLKKVKAYDADKQSVTGSVGNAYQFRMNQGGSDGSGLQQFVRGFWGSDIANIQKEAAGWLKKADGLDQFLENERLEREDRAGPMLRKVDGKRRKKAKNQEDDKSQATEYTEGSGYSVSSKNNYVYNVNAVITQGLGIAGKSGMPYDKVDSGPTKSHGKWRRKFATYFPHAAEWPKFHFIFFVFFPIIISVPMLAKIGKGSTEIDIDGNVAFEARFPAGFGISFLGVPAYYFLDGFVPNAEDLVAPRGASAQEIVDDFLFKPNPFGADGKVFISNADAELMFKEDFNADFTRQPDLSLAEIQSGILAQGDADKLKAIQEQQQAQEIFVPFIYALMHCAQFYIAVIPLTLIRESLEILARQFSFIRQLYPFSLWREIHMNFGLAGILYVVFGSTVFLVMMIVSMEKSTPFSGLAGDPNFDDFFSLEANVLYLRQLLLPTVPLLLLMKYASRGPPRWMVRYAPNFITKWYWEICYGLHYIVAFTAIIMLLIYRPQVFYWMGASWGFIYGGNKIVRILRTRKTTINNAQLISYTVEDKRNNAKKRTDVLRLTLNVPKSFPSSSRGQAVWLLVPEVDYFAHPFTIAKVPTPDDPTIMLHIGIKYLAGDDIISYARPSRASTAKMPAPAAAAPAAANPNELPPGWKAAVDPESGQSYYYNSAMRKTTWTKPRTGAPGLAVRNLTTRFSANFLRGGSTNFSMMLGGNGDGPGGVRGAASTNRATWTQKLAKLGEKLQVMDPDLRDNAIKDFPVYLSAPLGTSMDDCLLPSLPGSVIITTQNGLPAAESCVRWLLDQPRANRPKFHFFVSVSREVNDALSVVETLRDAMCEAVHNGFLNIDGLNPKHAHMCDWLGVNIHLTQRKPSTIEGDRDMLMASLNPPTTEVSQQELEIIETFLRNRIQPGRLSFDRFLNRVNHLVRKRTGDDKVAVGYCGSARIANSIRKAVYEIPHMKFDGEYI